MKANRVPSAATILKRGLKRIEKGWCQGGLALPLNPHLPQNWRDQMTEQSDMKTAPSSPCQCRGSGMIPAWATKDGRIHFCNCKLSPEIEKDIDQLIGEAEDASSDASK